MQSVFINSHAEFSERFAKMKPAGEISGYPAADEVVGIKEHVLEFAKWADEYLTELFAEARFTANASLPRGEVSIVEDYLHDEDVEQAFNNAAVMYPRKRAA